jgi:hypothetical protein
MTVALRAVTDVIEKFSVVSCQFSVKTSPPHSPLFAMAAEWLDNGLAVRHLAQ